MGRLQHRQAGEECFSTGMDCLDWCLWSRGGVSDVRVQRDEGDGGIAGEAHPDTWVRGGVGDGAGHHDRGSVRAAAVVEPVCDGRHRGGGAVGRHGGRQLEAIRAPVRVVGEHARCRGTQRRCVILARRLRPRRHRVPPCADLQDADWHHQQRALH